jgi:hypothetical protein
VLPRTRVLRARFRWPRPCVMSPFCALRHRMHVRPTRGDLGSVHKTGLDRLRQSNWLYTSGRPAVYSSSVNSATKP